MTARDPAQQPDADGRQLAESLAVAGVVHDVNQMLTVITGRAGLLLKRSTDPDLTRHLEAILLASGDAAAMLRRLGSDRDEVVAGDGTLREVAEQARLLVWPADDQAWPWLNQLDAQLQTAVPPQILREVLANLLLNALEVMPEGGGVVISAEVGPDERIQLRVADNGPGLPAGDPEEIFARGVSHSGEKGRGIGLAGCRQLLAGVGAYLTAVAPESSQETGAVFKLDLPGCQECGPVDGEPEAAVPALDVLVVDDEVVVRDMLRDVMGEWGCRVQAFRDSASVVAQYEPGSATVAVIDLNLPGSSGLELATQLRKGDPFLSIVMVTGWRQDNVLAEADPLVVDQKAHKPLELTNIRNILINGHQLNQARRDSAASE